MLLPLSCLFVVSPIFHVDVAVFFSLSFYFFFISIFFALVQRIASVNLLPLSLSFFFFSCSHFNAIMVFVRRSFVLRNLHFKTISRASCYIFLSKKGNEKINFSLSQFHVPCRFSFYCSRWFVNSASLFFLASSIVPSRYSFSVYVKKKHDFESC